MLTVHCAGPDARCAPEPPALGVCEYRLTLLLAGPVLGSILGNWLVLLDFRWPFRLMTILIGLNTLAVLFLMRETYAPVLERAFLARRSGRGKADKPSRSLAKAVIIRTFSVRLKRQIFAAVELTGLRARSGRRGCSLIQSAPCLRPVRLATLISRSLLTCSRTNRLRVHLRHHLRLHRLAVSSQPHLAFATSLTSHLQSASLRQARPANGNLHVRLARRHRRTLLYRIRCVLSACVLRNLD